MSSAGQSNSTPLNRHALTAVEKQRSQLEKLLKDPQKPAYIPPPPKEKSIRPAREMMKNVQGSSAGAGSGEFHVYKASRRREYERLKLLEEETRKETEEAEFEKRRRESEEAANSKTVKNRAKRLKKKERSKGKTGSEEPSQLTSRTANDFQSTDAPIKKRRLVNGKELVFKRPGADDSNNEDSDHEDDTPHQSSLAQSNEFIPNAQVPDILDETTKITIIEEL